LKGLVAVIGISFLPYQMSHRFSQGNQIQYAKGHKYLTLVYQVDLDITPALVDKDWTAESFRGLFTIEPDLGRENNPPGAASAVYKGRVRLYTASVEARRGVDTGKVDVIERVVRSYCIVAAPRYATVSGIPLSTVCGDDRLRPAWSTTSPGVWASRHAPRR
jgi:hypothetical protein